ncbi:RNA polymerase sigma-70 factor [Pedobacter deserti]|uniref:RNA polymerase sigma-70 factor n=1 Tax=Pedobacter deserti TaxID=2817382 RepID=UPI0021098EE7|nr:RNA polymerase sigma-70 factor [Pedobacter sp. SYSU D00382]
MTDKIPLEITPEVFSNAYDTYWRELYIAAYHYSKDIELSKEIIQEIFISLWERREDLQIHTSLKSYLYRAMRLKILEHFRKRAVRDNYMVTLLQQDLQSDSTEQLLYYKELEKALNSAVEQLPGRCREVYTLSRENGLDNRSIALALNISEKAVEGNMTRALRGIRSKLKIFR